MATHKQTTVSISEDEAKKIEDAAKDAGHGNLSFSNLARLALSKLLKIDLPPLARGGMRAGGCEPGNQHQRIAHANKAKKKRIKRSNQ